MHDISMAIMIDHGERCIIYGEIEIVALLEPYFRLEARRCTVEQDFIDELQSVTVGHPGYSFARAREVLAKTRMKMRLHLHEVPV
jgi:hypothetical protein